MAILLLSTLRREELAMIKTLCFAGHFSGGASRDRTGDLLGAMPALHVISALKGAD
jgi:hypothetical protein